MFLLETLIETLGFAHGALDVERAYVLPVLLQQRHQEVDSQVDVVHQLIFCHLHVSNSHSQTEHLQQEKHGHVKCEWDKLKATAIHGYQSAYLLHLEFDSRLDLIHLGHHVLIVGEQGGELASLVQPRSQDTRDLLDQRLRGQEGIILLG